MDPHTKKKLAEAFAGVIPNRMERNRWRGLLRYGPWRLMRLLWRQRQLHPNAPASQHYLSVCAIVKNEGQYFVEWLEWHLGQGVERFYIYDNESDDDTVAILTPYIDLGIVEYTFWPGRRQQIPAYDDCIERHRLDTRWLMFLDLDEFVVPERGTFAEYLHTMERHPSVELNWLIYGSNGQREKRPGKVMDRFTRHAEADYQLNRHVKSVVDPRRVACMTGCHEAARLPGTGPSVNSRGEAIVENFKYRPPVHDNVRVNHYAVKSYEEFLTKRERGRARKLDQRGLDYFDRYDQNSAISVNHLPADDPQTSL